MLFQWLQFLLVTSIYFSRPSRVPPSQSRRLLSLGESYPDDLPTLDTVTATAATPEMVRYLVMSVIRGRAVHQYQHCSWLWFLFDDPLR